MAHILLAEDDISMLEFLTTALENAGHEVQPACDGDSALEILKTNNKDFDLLLTDIVMPGIDGIELSKRVQKQYPDIKVMFITGFSAVSVSEAHKRDNPDTKVLSKPFHLNDLVAQVETLLAA